MGANIDYMSNCQSSAHKCGNLLQLAKENVMYSKTMFDEELKYPANQLH